MGARRCLHLGHRRSVDFDFFGSRPLDPDAVTFAIPFLVEPRLRSDSRTLWGCVVDRGGLVRRPQSGQRRNAEKRQPHQAAAIDDAAQRVRLSLRNRGSRQKGYGKRYGVRIERAVSEKIEVNGSSVTKMQSDYGAPINKRTPSALLQIRPTAGAATEEECRDGAKTGPARELLSVHTLYREVRETAKSRRHAWPDPSSMPICWEVMSS